MLYFLGKGDLVMHQYSNIIFLCASFLSVEWQHDFNINKIGYLLFCLYVTYYNGFCFIWIYDRESSPLLAVHSTVNLP